MKLDISLLHHCDRIGCKLGTLSSFTFSIYFSFLDSRLSVSFTLTVILQAYSQKGSPWRTPFSAILCYFVVISIVLYFWVTLFCIHELSCEMGRRFPPRLSPYYRYNKMMATSSAIEGQTAYPFLVYTVQMAPFKFANSQKIKLSTYQVYFCKTLCCSDCPGAKGRRGSWRFCV